MKKNSRSLVQVVAAPDCVKPHAATNCDLSALFADTALKDPATEPSIAQIVGWSWQQAQDGLRSIVEFGALLLQVESWLKARPGPKRGQGAFGLKNWLAVHCPAINYDTARGYREAAKGLLSLADKARDRPLLLLMGEEPLTDAEKEAAREQVRDVIATSSLRLLKAAAKADVEKAGPKKGGTSNGKRAKEPLALSEEWMQRAEAAANELGGVCMVAQAELLVALPERLRVVRAHVADCLRVLDGLCARLPEEAR